VTIDLLKKIAERSPVEYYGGCCDGGSRCFYCGSEYEPHGADCLWLSIRSVLGYAPPPPDQNVNELDEDYRRRKAREADIAAYGPMAPRQDVPTALEASLVEMANIFRRDFVAQFSQKAVSLKTMLDAVDKGGE
jgi:hypothetical protein